VISIITWNVGTVCLLLVIEPPMAGASLGVHSAEVLRIARAPVLIKGLSARLRAIPQTFGQRERGSLP
jgi:hypothetical protein